jgi:ABC-type dipeptide/oligopeptide/nickel transport system permease subunit
MTNALALFLLLFAAYFPTQATYDPPAPVAQTSIAATAPQEDEPGWDCATMGNHICGPEGNAPAGLYRDGVLIQPWMNYDQPELDPLYGVKPGTEYVLFGTDQYGGILGGAVCGTDAECAAWQADKDAVWDAPAGVGWVETPYGWEPESFN